MIRYIIAWLFLIAFFARISYGAESDPFSSVPIIPGSHSTLTLHELGQKAQKYLISCQNSDGSFGQDANPTVEDYLNGYLHAIVISWDNDRSMDALAMAVENKQNHDGSMRTASTSNSIGATALTILYPTVMQKTAHLYFSVPVKQTN
jgi:hypothetical protein